MKLKPLILSLAVLTALTFSACDGVKESSQPTETTSTTTSLSSSTEEIEYNGTFNEDIFNQICQNIKIGDAVMSMPCTFEKMGDGFETGEDPLLDEKNGILSSDLLYEDSIVGYISLRYTEDDTEWDDNEILGYSFSYYDIKKLYDSNYISVGGITFQDRVENLTSNFGSPSKINEHSNGDQSYLLFI